MVSFTKVCLGFVGIPMIPHRSNLPISMGNHKNSIKPVGMLNPLSQINKLFEKEPFQPLVPKELPENVLFGVRSDRDCQFDKYPELNELDTIEKKKEFITKLLLEWTEIGLDLSLRSLMSFKRLVEYIELPYDTLYSSLQKIYRKCDNRLNLDNILVLKHVFKKSGQVLPSDDYHEIYKYEDLDTSSILRLAKGSLISDEYMDILNDEMEQLELEGAVTYPKTVEEYREFKKKLLDLSTKAINFEEFPNYKIKQLSYVLYTQVWMIDYFKNREMPSLPEEVIKFLEVDEPYCRMIYNNLVKTQMDTITQEQIPHIVEKKIKVHRFLAYRKFMEAQMKFTLEEFKKFKVRSKEIIRKLKEKVGDLSKIPAEYKPFGIIGGEMPYVNVEVLVPEDKELEKKCAEEANKDLYEDEDEDEDEDDKDPSEFTKEEVEEIRRDIKKAQEELRIFSHMSQADKADFFAKKVPSAVDAAKRARCRRKHLEEMGNPFNTRSDLEEWEEHMGKTNQPEKKEKEAEQTDEEYAREKLAEIRTEYMKFLMQIDNLRWNLKNSAVSPVETFGKIFESGQSVIRPKAKKLDFTLPVYEECHEMLNSFKKKNLNNEAEKHRQKLLKEARARRLKQESPGDGPAFPGDPLIKKKDLPMLKEHLRTGGRLSVQSSMRTSMNNLTDSQKGTNFYRVTSSQPSEMRRCRKCDAVVFVGPLRTLEGEFFNVPQGHAFRTQKDFKCHNCGADKSELEETWPTGARGYKPVEYLETEPPPPPVDEYGFPLFE
ncbi:conserved hypothetical protein [Theileria orientalis strain Shintoku]|uniref:Uncharacterized protein n=1 Tax=Theileria orientalis strain Shintoku TaxID=869250 RepID=J4D9A4_THEOR|nr:conserved hypothetical protein [Theileria orientalis strain Shintoku]BAM41280.1 conserved hypothetical protein [Theileria orientalis strain Shintoku]|eukprot:XP_009691581.1 conserved hypothetical protein [Theileria orientalis strain Shintoku]